MTHRPEPATLLTPHGKERSMNVSDVMTREVVTVDEETPLKDVAQLLLEHDISGVPVVYDGRVVGVVSETDILYKERGLEGQARGPIAWLLDAPEAELLRKLGARTAGEAMTSPPVTIRPTRRLAQAAAMMLEHRVNRLPVVDGDRLVGLVTRSDMVRAFARSDSEIEQAIREDVFLRTLWQSSDGVVVDVSGGEVVLRGEVQSEAQADAIRTFASRVPGVVAVESYLAWPQGVG
jgi:CBS domain-containing protein